MDRLEEIRQRTEAGGPIRRIDMKYLLSEVDRLNDAHEAMLRDLQMGSAQVEALERERDSAVEDLYKACKHSPCNTGICVKKNCTGNHIPCEFEWCGPQEAGRNRRTQPENEPLTPCDVCQYSPPSSGDGKPCTICPASAKPERSE